MKYRKPRAINSVTFLLIACVGIAVYLAVYMWPVYRASARARAILHDHIPTIYKANLRGPEVANDMIDKMKESILTALPKAGIHDKNPKLIIKRDEKEVSLELQFKARATFPIPEKTFEFNLSPRVVSDAERINW